MLSDIQLVDRSPAGQILKLLQQQGSLSIKAIEAALGVTATAVRQQLTTLTTAEMVTAETVREKRGRPHAVYRLTVADRLHELSALLTAHGVMSKVDEAADAFMLTEYNCPYYGLAREHREVCGMEIEAMELALGAPITLYQSQLDGHTGCQFQVKK